MLSHFRAFTVLTFSLVLWHVHLLFTAFSASHVFPPKQLVYVDAGLANLMHLVLAIPDSHSTSA